MFQKWCKFFIHLIGRTNVNIEKRIITRKYDGKEF